MAKKPKAEPDRTYILSLKDGGVRRITIPAHWKMTFGQLVPFALRNNQPGQYAEVALRIYEGSKENLRGVMMDVVAFRDASIGILERRKPEPQKKDAKDAKNLVEELKAAEWINPDAEEQKASTYYAAVTAAGNGGVEF